MKLVIVVCAMLILLGGCVFAGEYESVMDVLPVAEIKPAGSIKISLPDEAALAVFENLMEGKIYLCDGYEITVQTLKGGDLAKTLQEITGFSKERLTVVETIQSELKRYDCVWSAMGETETQIGKTAILDDGNWHYVVTVMADASKAEELQKTWQELFKSISVSHIAP